MARLIEIMPEHEKIIVHKDCGAKIGYYPSEVKSAIYYDYGGGSDTWYYIKCPHCRKTIEVGRPK